MADLGQLRVSINIDDAGADETFAQLKRNTKTSEQRFKALSAGLDRNNKSMKDLNNEATALKNVLKNQKQMVDRSKQAWEEAADAHGKTSAKAQKLEQQYYKNIQSMRKYENQLQAVNRKMDNVPNKMDKLKTDLKDFGDTAVNTGEKMSSFGQGMTAGITAPIIGFGTMAVEMTKELRMSMAKLETNTKQAGLSVDTMDKSMRNLNAVTGETDANVEALSNLMATGMNDNQLLDAVDELSGAVIKFPDTLKIEGLADGLQETLATGKAIGPFAELLERMGVDLEKFDEGLAEAKDSGDDLNYVLGKLNDLDLSSVNEEFRETNKELIEGRNAQYDFMDALSELGEKIEPVATKLTEKVTDVVEAFNELDPKTQDTILKFAGVAAATGPVLMGLGGITTGIGNLSKGASGLVGLLGKAGGAGLIGRFALMGMGGPVGLAIGGISALAFAYTKLNDGSRDYIEINTEKLENMKKEIQTNDQLIDRFDELQLQNKLTSDEMLRYMDVLAELQESSAPAEIEKLKEEQKKLLEESTLTNAEMEEFLGLNEKVIEKAPGTAKAISEEGEAYAENTKQLQKLNREKRKELKRETRNQLLNALENEKNLVAQKKDIVAEINSITKEEEATLNRIKEGRQEVIEKENLIKDLKNKIANATGSEKRNLEGQLFIAKDHLEQARARVDMENQTRNKLGEQFTQQQKNLDKVREEIKANDTLKYKYEELILSQVGINAEKGEGLRKVNDELSSLRLQKSELKEKLRLGDITSGQYQTQVGKIDEQIGRFRTAQGELRQMNDLAGKTVYKGINVTFTPSRDKIARTLAITDAKSLNITTSGGGHHVAPGYAEGTDFHPGGLAVTGEEGYEIAKVGSRMKLMDFGLYDLPRGTQVFTHEESKRMLQSMGQKLDATSQDAPVPVHGNRHETSNTTNFNPNITINGTGDATEQARQIRRLLRRQAFEGGIQH